MRKEGVLFLVVMWLVGAIVFHVEQLVNAFLMFLLAGVVPGTQFAFSSAVMFFGSTVLLVALLMWAFRDALRERISHLRRTTNADYFARRRFRHIETQ